MKKFALAAALALAASTGFAGSIEEPVVEVLPDPVPEVESSSAGWVIPVLLLAVVAAIAAS